MNDILFRILSIGLLSAGIFLLVKVLRMLKKTFNGTIIAEIPFAQKQTNFQLLSPGYFAIWQKGQLFRKTPIADFTLQILDEKGAVIKLLPTWFNVQKNGWDTGRTELKKFSAIAGNYTLQILNEPSGNHLQNIIANMLPVKPVDEDQYFIEIRESQPVYYLLIAIPLLILSGGMIMVGLVASIIGSRMIADLGIIA